MKKTTLILFLLFFSKIGFSQITYFNYLDYTSEWRYYKSEWVVLAFRYTYQTDYFDGDTTINGEAYYKQFSTIMKIQTDPFTNLIDTLYSLEGPKFISEDATGSFYKLDAVSGIEEVFFDNQEIIDAQVGQPFPEQGGNCNVSSIEFLDLGSTQLKKILGANSANLSGSVEGVGVIGLSCYVIIESGSVLACYTKQGDNLQFFPTLGCDLFPIPVRTNNLSTSTLSSSDVSIDIYPNPTKDVFTVRSNSHPDNSSFQLLDMSGAIIKEDVLTDSHQTIDVENLVDGIYILKINLDNLSIFKRIVKN